MSRDDGPRDARRVAQEEAPVSPQDQARAFAQRACDVLKDALKPDHDILAREVQPLYEEIERSDRELAIYMERAEAAERREIEVAHDYALLRDDWTAARARCRELEASLDDLRRQTVGMEQRACGHFSGMDGNDECVDCSNLRHEQSEELSEAQAKLAELARENAINQRAVHLQAYRASEAERERDEAQAKLREAEAQRDDARGWHDAQVYALEAERALANRLGEALEKIRRRARARGPASPWPAEIAEEALAALREARSK